MWTEDRGAGFHYWQLVNEYLFHQSILVESKGSNQGILDAVRTLIPQKEDTYYIAFDIIYDNMDIMNKYIELQELTMKYPDQIKILDITCFEYIILSFHDLIEWTGTGKKDKIVMREQILKAFKKHRIEIESIEDSKTLNYLRGFKKYSTEKVLKSIARELTDYEEWSVKGKQMGRCWYENCCVLKRADYVKCNVPDGMLGSEKILSLIRDRETQRIVEGIKE